MSNCTAFRQGALIGAAAGLRSQLPLAVICRSSGSEVSKLGSVAARRISLALALSELVVDKLPNTASRLDRGPFIARLVLGAGGAGVLARRAGGPWMAVAAVGAIFAGASAKVGHDLRSKFAENHNKTVGAVVEDVVAVEFGRASRSLTDGR